MLINICKHELIKERFYMNMKLSKKTLCFIIVNLISIMTLSSQNTFIAFFLMQVLYGLI